MQATELPTRGNAEVSLNPLIILEPELEGGRRIRLVVGQSQRGVVTSRRDVGDDRKLTRELIARFAAPHDQHAEAIGIVPIPFGGQALDRECAWLARVAEERAQEGQLFLHQRVFALQIVRLAGQCRLRPMGEVEITLELGEPGAELTVFLPDRHGIGFQPGLLLGDRAAIEPTEKLPEIEAPPPRPGGQRDRAEQRGQAPAPRQVGAHRHPGRTDAEGLAQPAADGAQRLRHQGSTGGAARPVVSGKPNSRFMFWMAWPAAPLTRLSTTARTTAMSPS